MGQGIKIGSNISSLTAQRRLGEATSNLSKTYEKLSSGQRISKACDDAAGLAIADTLKGKTKVYSKGVQNLNDGISVVSIADAAVGELTNITMRLTELAEQAANGAYTNKQREALDKEAQALAKEYFRISRSTQFNGVNLFDGSVQGLALQGGFGTDGIVQSSLGGVLGTGSFNPHTLVSTLGRPYQVAVGDLNGDGHLDIAAATDLANVSIRLGDGSGTFPTLLNYGVGNGASGIDLGDVNGDGIFDLVVANSSDMNISVLIGNGDGTFKSHVTYQAGAMTSGVSLGDLNGDGFLDIVSANMSANNLSVLLGNGNGTFNAQTTYATGTTPAATALGDVNGDGILDILTANSGSANASLLIGNGNGTFRAQTTIAAGTNPSSVALGYVNGDEFLDLVISNSGAGNNVSVCLGNGNGTFAAQNTFATGTGPLQVALGDLNGDGCLDIVTANAGNSVSVLSGNGDGYFNQASNYSIPSFPKSVALGDLNDDGVLDIVAGKSASTTVSVLTAITRDGISPILPFSLRTQADALQAMAPLKRTLESLGIQRGVLGAFESRLSAAIATLGAAAENSRAAESRIRDADIAQESATMVRQQILQQVGTAMLGQANQAPAIALSLLQQA